MRHLLIFLGTIFLGLFIILVYRNSHLKSDTKPVLRVYASSSFISQWGPGPWLKAEFEKTCQCKVEFQESIDSYLMIQKIKSESVRGVDVVMGFDQFDLELARQSAAWKKVERPLEDQKDSYALNKVGDFVPYDYSLVSFVHRISDLSPAPQSFQELSREDLKNQLVLIDPRSSSLGLQMLLWLVTSYGEEKAFELLKSINENVKIYASSWSGAYGLFKEKQAGLVLSYVTSPLYHKIEEKDMGYSAAAFKEGHPLQIEYAGIPEACKECELAQEFINLVLSENGQKIIVQKNYMFPVLKDVLENSIIKEIPPYERLPIPAPSISERERLIKKWTQLRRSQ